MCQVEILAKEKKKNEFIQQHLINGKVGFLNKEKQSQDWNYIRRTSQNKIVSTLQKYC